MRECEEELVANQISQEKLLKHVFGVLAAASLACGALVLVSEIASGQFAAADTITAAAAGVVGAISVAEARDSSRKIHDLSGQQR